MTQEGQQPRRANGEFTFNTKTRPAVRGHGKPVWEESPPATTAEDVWAWVDAVEVPDWVVVNVLALQPGLRDGSIQRLLDFQIRKRMAEWDAANPAPSDSAGVDAKRAWEDARLAAEKAKREELRAIAERRVPRRLTEGQAVAAAKLLCADRIAETLSDAEQEAYFAVKVRDEDGRVLSKTGFGLCDFPLEALDTPNYASYTAVLEQYRLEERHREEIRRLEARVDELARSQDEIRRLEARVDGLSQAPGSSEIRRLEARIEQAAGALDAQDRRVAEFVDGEFAAIRQHLAKLARDQKIDRRTSLFDFLFLGDEIDRRM